MIVNVRSPSGVCATAWYAPMCCVIPPASALTVGLADRVEQFGLTVIDVTHHGHHRRPRLEIAGLALVLSEFEVEGLQELAVFVLGRNDLHIEVQLGASIKVSSSIDCVAVTISPRPMRTLTRSAGDASIFSAKSVSDAPRGSRTVSPEPRGSRTPPSVGASMLSNS